MKIKDYGEIVDIFAIYWVEDRVFFYGLRPASDGGRLLAYDPVKVSIEDASIPFRTVVYKFHDGYGVFHWALIEKNLLDDLLESGSSAYNTFVSIIKSENLVSKEFA